MGAPDRHYLTSFSNTPSLPKWTLKGRWKEEAKTFDCGPGPGSYYRGRQGAIRRDRGVGFGFGDRQGARVSDPHVPGPGIYKVEFGLTRGSRLAPPHRSVSKGGRKKWSDVPGPGAYVLPSTLGGKKCSLHRRDCWGSRSRRVIGPAASSLAPVPRGKARPQSAPPGFSFGTSSRPRLSRCDPAIPGPAAYRPQSAGHMGRSASFGRRYADITVGRFEIRPESATYCMGTTLGSKAYSFPKQDPRPRPRSAPPGRKELGEAPSTLGAKAYSFSKDIRAKQGKTSETPDAIPLPSTFRDDLGFDFGRSDRPPLSTCDQSIPGPGCYRTKSSLGTKACSINKNRGKDLGRGGPGAKESLSKPGPGTYDQTLARNGLTTVLGTGKRPPLSTCDPAIPGPATYDVRGAGGRPMRTCTLKERWRDGTGRSRRHQGPGPADSTPYTNFGY